MHDRKLNGCWQRLLFARQLTQRKCSLCSQGTMVVKMSLRTWIFVISIVIVVIPTGLLCQMQAKSLGVKFPWIICKFRKRKIISLLLVHVSIKCDVKVHVRYFQVIVMQWWQWNVQKSVQHVRSFCFAYSAYWRFRFHHCCGILNSRILKWCHMEKFDERCSWGCTFLCTI